MPESNFVSLIIDNFMEMLAKATAGEVVGRFFNLKPKLKEAEIIEFQAYEQIKDLYQGENKLRQGQFIEISGTLSIYAPLLPGSPNAKKDFHRKIRRDIKKIEELLEKRYNGITPTTIDSLIAYSSGQMVIRKEMSNSRYYYLGLYQSIVRNSMPVFIDKEYYHKVVSALFSKSGNNDTIEAKVKGKIQFFVHRLEDIIEGSGMGEIFDNNYFEQLENVMALYVDGPDYDGTKVEFLGRARYTDGDIWVAVKNDKVEKVVSRFLDLADVQELSSEKQSLRDDAEVYFGGWEVLSQFDEVETVFKSKKVPRME
jgi:CRISPR/Cas system-associated endonuclease Cas3-HD